jgi:hypothetical protein
LSPSKAADGGSHDGHDGTMTANDEVAVMPLNAGGDWIIYH